MLQTDQYLCETSGFDEAEALIARSLAIAGEAERESPGMGRAALIELSVLFHRAGHDLLQAARAKRSAASSRCC
jgi:hypothetical protein